MHQHLHCHGRRSAGLVVGELVLRGKAVDARRRLGRGRRPGRDHPCRRPVGPVGAIVLGVVAAVVCCLAVIGLKPMLDYDDSLDVFGVHGVGGIVGALGTASSLRRRSAASGRARKPMRSAASS